MCVLDRGIHISGFAGDWQLVREAPGRNARLWSNKRRSVGCHLLISEPPNDVCGKNSLDEYIVSKNHLLSDPGSSELLKGFASRRVKILPGGHGPNELHKRKPLDKLPPAGSQVKCQRASPVVRNDECRRDSSLREERIEVTNMIGKPVPDVWFSRLAEPDEIRCDAVCHRCNQWDDISPDVRRRGIPV